MVIRDLLAESCRELGYPFHEQGVYVNTSGPRFETPAEIVMFKTLAIDIVGMTNVPEVSPRLFDRIDYTTIAIA